MDVTSLLMDDPPSLDPHEKPDKAAFLRLARRLLREMAEHDEHLAEELRSRGVPLDG